MRKDKDLLRDMSPLPRSPRFARHPVWLVTVLSALLAGTLLAGTLLAACGAATGQRTSLFAAPTAAPTATATSVPTVAAPTPISQPTVAPIPKSSLPTLAPPAGWRTIFTLSDTTGAHGDDIAQQTFIVTSPYIILFSCKGSGGAIKVLYQGTIGGADCSGPSVIHRTGTLTSAQPDHSAFVTVSPLGTVIWELLVAIRD